MTSLDTAIIKTLAYADLFNQSLTTDELHKYLIEYKLDDPQKLIDQSISKVSYSNNLWSLQANQKTVNLKKGQLKTTEYKIQHAKKYTKIFLLLPWIKFVGITGSIAGGTPTKTDDIDLLIITDQNRLWLTRLFLTIMLNMLGKRRKPNAKQSQINDKFCLNMWLAMDNLQEKHQDIYTANEIARIIPLLNRQDSFAHYLLSNNWTAKYLPNFQI